MEKGQEQKIKQNFKICTAKHFQGFSKDIALRVYPCFLEAMYKKHKLIPRTL